MIGTNIADTDDDTSQVIDELCEAVPTCVANSGDHRKVVSHIFGRNKTCTRDLPQDLWISWCRKHYQRLKYRAEGAEETTDWRWRQMELVRDQLQIFEKWDKVRSWTIALRKAERIALAKMRKEAKMNKDSVIDTNKQPLYWARFLVPYLGSNKTFAQVREVLDAIEHKFDEEGKNKENKERLFPGVEFLPTIPKSKEITKPVPATNNGKAYRKITLDQPAFKRKTKANAEYLKEQATKEADGTNTPTSSRPPSRKATSPDTGYQADSDTTSRQGTSTPDIDTIALTDAPHSPADKTRTSKTQKRNHLTPIPKAGTPKTNSLKQPLKRRRLTRGYEKHQATDDKDPTATAK